MLDALRRLYNREPARVIAVVVSAVVALATALGIVVDEESLGEILSYVAVILLGGEATRRKVTPAP